jgi:hypothetical protein
MTPQPVEAVLEKKKFGCWYDTSSRYKRDFQITILLATAPFLRQGSKYMLSKCKERVNPGKNFVPPFAMPMAYSTSHYSVFAYPTSILVADTEKQTGMFPILNAMDILDYRYVKQ